MMKQKILIILLFICSSISAQTIFTRIPSNESGVRFVNYLVESHDFNPFNYEYLYNGGGVAAGDINNDGLTDIFFTSNIVPNKLYLNEGNFKFKDISQSAGIDLDTGFHTGVTMVDINNDGFLDIYVCRSASADPEQRRNVLYINNGNLTFSDKTKQYGIDDASYHTQAYFNDMDLDGDVDLFLLNHPRKMVQTNNIIVNYDKAGKLIAQEDTTREYVSYRYYENNNGYFIDKTFKAGLGSYAFGLSAIIDDFNDDGYPDIYACNDYYRPDFLFINNKNGTFTNKFDDYFEHTALNSMGSDYADINNDGYSDLIILDMLPETLERQKKLKGPVNYDVFNKRVQYGFGYQYLKNVLQLNNGNGSYSDISYLAGVAFTEWSWAPIVADFDNDGLKDLFVTNGYYRDVTDQDFSLFKADSIRKALFKSDSDKEAMALLGNIPSVKVQNYLYRNNGNLTFENMNDRSGMRELCWSNGAAYADLDNDGDLDLIINNINDESYIYRNNSIESKAGNYVRFRFEGPEKNKGGLWANVEITMSDGKKKQYQRYYPNRGYISQHENILHFGTGNSETVSVKVTWPDRKVQDLQSLKCNTIYTLKHAEAVTSTEVTKQNQPTVFEDVTEKTKLKFEQKENDYIDFKLEPLLPHQFSKMGPSISVGDVNGDKLDDVFISGRKDVAGLIYVQSAAGTFTPLKQPALELDKRFEDTGSALFDADNDGDNDLLVVAGGNDTPDDNNLYVTRLYINNGKGIFAKSDNFPSVRTSGKSVAIEDFDKDGYADIYLGGRVVPGHYGLIAPGFLLKNNKGEFTEITNAVPGLKELGMVTDAIWCDVDNDSWKDLVIVGEWMPVTIYKNVNGKLDANPQVINQTNGWWSSVAAVDIDKDGDLDLIGGNVGMNTRYRGNVEFPLTMVASDFDKNGSTDCVISMYENGISYPMVLRDNLLDQMIYLKKKYLRYADYCTQTVNDIFTPEQLSTARKFKAEQMLSCIFTNDGKGNFTLQPMHVRTQFSPINAIIPEDVDKDGFMDLLMAGNDYATEVETGRSDAGIGVFLRNNGNATFRSIPVSVSGFYVPGDVKCMEKITINNKPCFIVGRNQGKVQIIGYR